VVWCVVYGCMCGVCGVCVVYGCMCGVCGVCVVYGVMVVGVVLWLWVVLWLCVVCSHASKNCFVFEVKTK